MVDNADRVNDLDDLIERRRDRQPYREPVGKLEECDICEERARLVNGMCQKCRDAWSIK